MQVLIPGQPASLSATIDATVAAGVTLTTVQFDVVDEKGTVVQAAGAGTIVTNVAPFAVTLPIAADTTTIVAGKTRGIRQARMTLTTSDGLSLDGSVEFVLRSGEGLVIGENSFLTYLEAELIGFEQMGLDSWAGAEKADRINALMSARDDLCQLQFVYEPFEVSQMTRIVNIPGGFGVWRPALWTAADLATLPDTFMDALKKSQVIQASYLLGDSPDEHARASGLMSKTVGQSSQMYRPGIRPLEFPVCKRALQALAGYTTIQRWRPVRG